MLYKYKYHGCAMVLQTMVWWNKYSGVMYHGMNGNHSVESTMVSMVILPW
jgi:hypothetical protein